MGNRIIIMLKRTNFTEIVFKYRQFILYSIIGAASAGLDFLVFTFLTNFFLVNYIIANIVSVNCGIANSFLFNRRFNFKVRDRALKRFATFYAVGSLGLFVSSILLWLFVEVFILEVIISKIIVIFIITILQFSLNKLITFKIN